jgi:hypothetical protein
MHFARSCGGGGGEGVVLQLINSPPEQFSALLSKPSPQTWELGVRGVHVQRSTAMLRPLNLYRL